MDNHKQKLKRCIRIASKHTAPSQVKKCNAIERACINCPEVSSLLKRQAA